MSQYTLRIYLASSGRCFNHLAKPSQLVSSVKQWLVTQSDIATHDQILLCQDGLKLDSRHELGNYSALFKENPDAIYLFNRQDLHKPHSASLTLSFKVPSLFTPDDFKLAVPASPVDLVDTYPLLRASQSLMIRALPDYERAFAFHLRQSQAFLDGATSRAETCYIFLEQQKAQLRALDAAIKNLHFHTRRMESAFNEFSTLYEQQSDVHTKSLQEFEFNLEQLRKVELHSALRTAERSTVLDCIEEGQLRAWALECKKSSEQLGRKVIELRNVREKLSTDGLHTLPPTAPKGVETVDGYLSEWSILHKQALQDALTLEKDHVNVKTVIETTIEEIQNAQPISINPVQLCEACEVNLQQHRAILDRFETLWERVTTVMEALTTSQTSLSELFYSTLWSISDLSSSIKTLENKVHLFLEAMKHEEKMFVELSNIKKLPQAYPACLVEIVRRRQFTKALQTSATTAAGRFDSLRQLERTKRHSFNSKYGQFLPNGFLPILNKRAPWGEVRLHGLINGLDDLPPIDSLEETDLQGLDPDIKLNFNEELFPPLTFLPESSPRDSPTTKLPSPIPALPQELTVPLLAATITDFVQEAKTLDKQTGSL